MKTPLCLAVCLLAATAALADEPPLFQIESVFESISVEKPDPALLRKPEPDAKTSSPGHDILAAPRVTTKAGQRATVELIREVPVPGGTGDGKGTVLSGVVLDVTPDYRDGKIKLTGRATVRNRLEVGDKQPLGAVSFNTRETYFGGEVTGGQPLTIQIGEAPDTSNLTLTVTRVEEVPREKHAAAPNYHVYAVNPSPEDVKKPIFQLLRLDSGDISPVAIAGIFSPADLGPEHAEAWRPVTASLQEIPAAEAPIKIASILGPDGRTLDVTIRSAKELGREIETSVSIYWGSDILLTVVDPTQPGGRRGLLIRQD